MLADVVRLNHKLTAWKRGTFPVEHTMANLDSNWCRGDTEENYKKHGSSRYTPESIRYVTNSCGFRDDRPVSAQLDGSIACFGDSFTFGVGLPQNKIWSTLVGGENFGLPGYSSDGVARLVFQLVPQMQNLRTMFVMLPGGNRKEVYTNNVEHSPKQFSPYSPTNYRPSNMTEEEILATKHLANDYDALATQCRALALMSMTCHNHNVKFFWTTWDQVIIDLPADVFDSYFYRSEYVHLDPYPIKSTSRDGIHPGEDFHERLAQLFKAHL